RASFAPREAREARDRPLVVDDIEDNGRVVDRGEGERGMKVALRRRPFPHPRRSDAAVVLHGARHRKPGRLGKLRTQVAGNGEEVHGARRIEDRKLPSLQPVGAVRIDLVDHLHDWIAARDHASLLPVRREDHVVEIERLRRADRGRFLARALEVEAGLPLPLGAVHSVIERSGQRHQPQQLAQFIGRETRIPRPVGMVVVAQDADQVVAKGPGLRSLASFVRPRLRPRLGDGNVREIHGIAGTETTLRHVKRQARTVASGIILPVGHGSLPPGILFPVPDTLLFASILVNYGSRRVSPTVEKRLMHLMVPRPADRRTIMQFLITGTAGFIGYHLARRLLDHGHSVTGFDCLTDYYGVLRKHSRLGQLSEYAGCRHGTGMLEDRAALDRAATSAAPEIIVHLAAQAGVRYSIEATRSYIDSNLTGSWNVLELARDLKPQHLLM